MIGKRRFTVILVSLGICAGVEMISQLTGNGGWSANGQLALMTITGLYFGSKFFEKAENGGK
jgi:hypothetical protein